jgi:hypothetical protein
LNKKQTWPNDADGDVFRNLLKKGFDFEREYVIDFNIDFESWPKSDRFVSEILAEYPTALIKPIDEEYYLVQITAVVDYDFIVRVQETLTEIAKSEGGFCESWGILH